MPTAARAGGGNLYATVFCTVRLEFNVCTLEDFIRFIYAIWLTIKMHLEGLGNNRIWARGPADIKPGAHAFELVATGSIVSVPHLQAKWV